MENGSWELFVDCKYKEKGKMWLWVQLAIFKDFGANWYPKTKP